MLAVAGCQGQAELQVDARLQTLGEPDVLPNSSQCRRQFACAKRTLHEVRTEMQHEPEAHQDIYLREIGQQIGVNE